jgi:homoserine O-acetyltransferase/O-succinyltransferase
MQARRSVLEVGQSFELELGGSLPEVSLAFEAYGTLDGDGENAVLLCHSLSHDQRAGPVPERGPGWWEDAIGPGRAIDTDRFFVLVPNVLGGWGGGTSPRSVAPATGERWGLDFPMLTIGDMVAADVALSRALGIRRFAAAIGGCFGGFRVLEWMARAGEMLDRAVVISATPRTSAHSVALWRVLRDAIRLDPKFREGRYEDDDPPADGVALMARFGSLFWISRDVLEERFGLAPAAGGVRGHGFDSEFAVEALLDRVGSGDTASAFDALSFLYLTRAIDYFDLAPNGTPLASAFESYRGKTLLVSYASDWRYPPERMAEIEAALVSAGKACRHDVLESDFGHGAFLHDVEGVLAAIRDFLA